MSANISEQELNTLLDLSAEVQELIESKKYEACLAIVIASIGKYPHSPQPHNLMGIVLEATGDAQGAMKHYRAAIALEPSYMPARENLYRKGDLSNNSTAYTYH